jgi:hypothetical protein
MVEERKNSTVPRRMACVKCGMAKDVQIPIQEFKMLAVAQVPHTWICSGCDATGLAEGVN